MEGNLSELMDMETLQMVLDHKGANEIVDDYPGIIEEEHTQLQISVYNNLEQNRQHLNNVYNNVKTEYPPSNVPSIICTDEYAGPFNFEVYIDPHRNAKWVYSAVLGKVYILVNDAFPVDFKWDPVDTNLYVRATTIFCSPQYAQKLVTTCIQHSIDNADNKVQRHVLQHVLRCCVPNAMYCGSKEEGNHLSVLLPLGKPQSGSETVRHIYNFVCKNSCVTGMNRRAIQIVFTLEDDQGTVHGRKCIEARICSCPKRDKEKDELDFKNKGGQQRIQRGKKRKAKKQTVDDDDGKGYTVTLSLSDKEMMKDALKSVYNIVCAKIVNNNDNNPQKYTRDLEHVKELMSTFTNPSCS